MNTIHDQKTDHYKLLKQLPTDLPDVSEMVQKTNTIIKIIEHPKILQNKINLDT